MLKEFKSRLVSEQKLWKYRGQIWIIVNNHVDHGTILCKPTFIKTGKGELKHIIALGK